MTTRPILFRLTVFALAAAMTIAILDGLALRAAASRGDLPVLHLGRAEP
ncbi:hypothetical protein HNR00_003548 [Methylorubrum rhodinum]|uniref:Uncharacterized protein n=1 Tax=Methylorubrum rhodinum TaxID=29428 RepID=A0A840ZPL5_9HYPH|nr:hypothetical protein [Methylorubrum rhodinum]MBB5758821.1 hypothetical protein [Methylorubrum rhodinum]